EHRERSTSSQSHADLQETIGARESAGPEVQLRGENSAGDGDCAVGDRRADLCAGAGARRIEQLELQVIGAVRGSAAIAKPALIREDCRLPVRGRHHEQQQDTNNQKAPIKRVIVRHCFWHKCLSYLCCSKRLGLFWTFIQGPTSLNKTIQLTGALTVRSV